MGAIFVQLITIYDKMAQRIPLMTAIKQSVCYLRWLAYKVRIKRYGNLANQSNLQAKILVLMDAGIGNAVEATPLVQAIRLCWPKAEITIRTLSGDLFDKWDVVNHVITNPKQLKGEIFSHTFVAWGGAISANRGYCKMGKIHFTEEGLQRHCTKPEREYNLDSLRRLGYKGPTPALYVTPKKTATDIMPPFDILKISLVPASKTTYQFRNKRWPYFEQLGKSLLNTYKNSCIFIIGTSEDQVSSGLLELPHVIDLRSKLSLAETAWILKNSDLVIGNDCGPMHIADAVNVPLITIFGPTCDIKNGPISENAVILRHKMHCAPCQYDRKLITCNNPLCMLELFPEVILEQAKKLLERTGHPCV